MTKTCEIQNLEECLESLYIKKIEKNFDEIKLSEFISKNDVDALLSNNYIVKNNNLFIITDKGLKKGRNIVRRHRLAEKLLFDVLDIKEKYMNETACGFEHYISENVEEKICSFLGHPTTCPHGNHIPEGKCCLKARKDLEKLNIPLTKLVPGEEAAVIYLNTKNNDEMQKLMSIGLLPGVKIKILRVYPSIVFELGYSQFAIDENIGDIVFVRKSTQLK